MPTTHLKRQQDVARDTLTTGGNTEGIRSELQHRVPPYDYQHVSTKLTSGLKAFRLRMQELAPPIGFAWSRGLRRGLKENLTPWLVPRRAQHLCECMLDQSPEAKIGSDINNPEWLPVEGEQMPKE